jgi:enoyl-CoA hydratase
MTNDTATASTPILVERRGAALWLRLNRPQALNGLDPEILDGLEAGLDAAAADADVRCVVIGAEGRAFCAGADLAFASSLGDAPHPGGRFDAATLFLHRVREVFDRIEAFEKPVIAAIEGVTVGGGLELALCCDIVVAAESAPIGDGHAKFGQIPGGGGTARLPRRVGVSFAKRLMFTGELLPATDYLHTDLVDRVAKDGQVVEAVDSLVDQIAGKSPVGVARMKSLIHDSLEVPTPLALTAELEQSDLHRRSADWREGIDAFNGKRNPTFTGS